MRSVLFMVITILLALQFLAANFTSQSHSDQMNGGTIVVIVTTDEID